MTDPVVGKDAEGNPIYQDDNGEQYILLRVGGSTHREDHRKRKESEEKKKKELEEQEKEKQKREREELEKQKLEKAKIEKSFPYLDIDYVYDMMEDEK